MASVRSISTRPFEGQKPGTSGLRKRVAVFKQEHYTENFVQGIFTAMPAPGPQGATVVVGGDGRPSSASAPGNGIAKFIIGQDGILSTPAASAVIRKREADGGIILTASHNAGGPENDFGIKYNTRNGWTRARGRHRRHLRGHAHYFRVGTQRFEGFEVEVIDPVADYVELIKTIFDFELIKSFRTEHADFKLLFDGLNGVTGPYGRRIFVEELGFPETLVARTPDPNLIYAHKLVERVEKEKIDLGAASDGDGDRNMIISHDWFVTPSDSVALIAEYAEQAIPYFKGGLKGLARSMPTSCAIDLVAKAKNLEAFEVPTGWKFFGNLMDAGRLSICGEESFGTGSDHIREKDGIWAVLAWLNIIAFANKGKPGASVRSIMSEFHHKYGRNYFTRYDYEEVESEGANKMMERLRGLAQEGGENEVVGQTFHGYKVAKIDDFEYHDPIDHSVSKKQGVRVIFEDTSRVIFRLSGTGSHGATVRIYIERYDRKELDLDAQVALKPLVDGALEISKLEAFTGRKVPTVIT
ncbi:hypothetical protein DL89DRAFT_294586 [Linderina pennispora]|uniref:phosphoglucomutase (alpha-D-glucose-1,6-bisphosphate-dependent) n=1 Tax=Linderina pennispora TaxID=61395 RepID=A0A1Y1W2M9_9FUNG|nr:uncharacterized protein DL89DRAFT_294586 [Linderina pennispora]ORX67394.1 hypothetical protein DL89DRAFT_294586 [Linderina pennispora]